MFGLKAQLKRVGREGDPTPEFRAALLARLTGRSVARRSFRFALVGITSVALVFGMGTGVYAYASPDVSEGTALYPIKRGIETVEQTLATTPEARAAFHVRMMGRRMREAERIASQQDRVSDALQRAADELDLSVDALDGGTVAAERHRRLLEELSANSDRYADLFDRLPGNGMAPPGSLPPPERLRERVRGAGGMMRP